MPPTSKPSEPAESSSRFVVSLPPSEWYAHLRLELISAGIDHDRAGLIARRVLTALIPRRARFEAMDRRNEPVPKEH